MGATAGQRPRVAAQFGSIQPHARAKPCTFVWVIAQTARTSPYFAPHAAVMSTEGEKAARKAARKAEKELKTEKAAVAELNGDDAKPSKKRKAEKGGAEQTPGDKKAKKGKADKKAAAADAKPSGSDSGSDAPPTPAVVENALDGFRLAEPIKSLLRSKGIESLFAIQASTLDLVVEGKDLVGRARTGCGKTLAFVLPIVQSLLDSAAGTKRAFGRHPSCIVLAPTRELAKQVGVDLTAGGRARLGVEAATAAASAACPPHGAIFNARDCSRAIGSIGIACIASTCNPPDVAGLGA